MNLSLYCSVAEAAAIAGVSKGYMHTMIDAGRIKAEKVGRSYAVLRSSAAAFKRQPGMGRPTKSAYRKTPAKRPRKAKTSRKKKGK